MQATIGSSPRPLSETTEVAILKDGLGRLEAALHVLLEATRYLGAAGQQYQQGGRVLHLVESDQQSAVVHARIAAVHALRDAGAIVPGLDRSLLFVGNEDAYEALPSIPGGAARLYATPTSRGLVQAEYVSPSTSRPLPLAMPLNGSQATPNVWVPSAPSSRPGQSYPPAPTTLPRGAIYPGAQPGPAFAAVPPASSSTPPFADPGAYADPLPYAGAQAPSPPSRPLMGRPPFPMGAPAPSSRPLPSAGPAPERVPVERSGPTAPFIESHAAGQLPPPPPQGMRAWAPGVAVSQQRGQQEPP